MSIPDLGPLDVVCAILIAAALGATRIVRESRDWGRK